RVVSSSIGASEDDQWLSPHGYNESVSYQTQRQRVLSPGEVAKLPPGQGLLLRGANWGLIGLTRWFEREPWRGVGGGKSSGCSYSSLELRPSPNTA
ncbi:MAG: hypothetical protein WAN65_23100, partial [Candidatus Sulfotelmatobacter sp.]